MARIIRDYRPEDEPAVCALHERRTDGEFPDLSSPLYIAKIVVEDDGRITGMAYIRKTATTHIDFVHPCSDEEKFALVYELQTELLNAARTDGLHEIYMTIQRPLGPGAEDRLKAFGWTLVPDEPLYEHLTRFESVN